MGIGRLLNNHGINAHEVFAIRSQFRTQCDSFLHAPLALRHGPVTIHARLRSWTCCRRRVGDARTWKACFLSSSISSHQHRQNKSDTRCVYGKGLVCTNHENTGPYMFPILRVKGASSNKYCATLRGTSRDESHYPVDRNGIALHAQDHEANLFNFPPWHIIMTTHVQSPGHRNCGCVGQPGGGCYSHAKKLIRCLTDSRRLCPVMGTIFATPHGNEEGALTLHALSATLYTLGSITLIVLKEATIACDTC